MKKLLVASVYAPTKRNATWLQLQLHFLRKTVSSFDLAVYLNRTDPALFERECLIIDTSVYPPPPPRTQPGKPPSALLQIYHKRGSVPREWSEHSWSLDNILKFFRQHRDYEHYLILDSDAFPWQYQWLETLLHWMQPTERLAEKQFAAAVRTENLDTFPHPCVFFIKGSFLEHVSFTFREHLGLNLVGFPYTDVGSGVSPFHEGQHVFLPLVRTNAWNPHPILGAIYGGLFYHHGAGSRTVRIRSVILRYFDHLISPSMHEQIDQQLFQDLSTNPERLVQKLAGTQTAAALRRGMAA